MLFQFDHGFHAHEVHDYIAKQENCVSVTWNEQTTDGPAMTAEVRARKAADKEKKDAERKAKEDEKDKVKKWEEKQKRKKKAAKKAANKAKKAEL